MKFLLKAGMGLLSAALIMGATAVAGTYKVDGAHSQVGFSVKHLVVSTVRGSFTVYDGSVDINENTKEISNIRAEIDVASVDTGRTKRDQHLISPDFFDAANYPKITFQSTSIKKKSGNEYEVVGDLTIRGVTKSVTLTGEMTGMINDAKMGKIAGFTAEGMINRQDFGVKWNRSMDSGGLVVSDEVKLVIEIEAKS